MAKSGIERRKHARKEVLETFHVFLVIPKYGLRRLHLRDVSEGGVSFAAEPGDNFPQGTQIDCLFYINPSLKLPLSIRVAHVTNDESSKRVGCEFADTSSKAYKSFVKFLGLLDELAAFLDQ